MAAKIGADDAISVGQAVDDIIERTVIAPHAVDHQKG